MLKNLYDPTLDRAYDYDNVGRLIEARTGSEARGQLIGQGGTQDGPYAHSYRYDQMGKLAPQNQDRVRSDAILRFACPNRRFPINTSK